MGLMPREGPRQVLGMITCLVCSPHRYVCARYVPDPASLAVRCGLALSLSLLVAMSDVEHRVLGAQVCVTGE